MSFDDWMKISQYLEYDPLTGIITCIKERPNIKVGDIAGCDGGDGYRTVRINGERHKAHRLAWLLYYREWPTGEIDHINGDGHDNRLFNLRDVSHRDNQKNQKLLKTNNSGTCGVFWNKGVSKWAAQIKICGKNKHLGYFTEKDDAIKARQSAEQRHGFHENHGSIR